MAVGDSVVGLSASVADAAYMNIQPGSGVKWSIHNLFWANSVEIYWYDGTNSILIDSMTGNGARLNTVLECTNTKYLRVKNVAGETQNLGYSGREI